jgi:DNA helicase-2/ATP-dependent DNA helicase PcrA
MNTQNHWAEKMHIHLDEQQLHAAQHQKGPALVLAGPGSGKTTVIIGRVLYLINEMGVQPDKILALTFNKAAALEMKYRFKNIVPFSVNVAFSTLHSLCYSIVRKYERLRGKKLRLIEGSKNEDFDKRKILKKIYLELNTESINDDQLDDLINEIGFVKNRMIQDYKGYHFSVKRFPDIYRAYEAYKSKNLLMDFDDMLVYAHRILIKIPSIRHEYRQKYEYLLVDEGQDLSKIQFEIIKLLVNPINNIYFVADDDQSIYGFRGAEPEYILNVDKAFPNCKRYLLETNYRSSKNIVEISSSFIKANTERYDKNHMTNNVSKRDPVIIESKSDSDQIQCILKIIDQVAKQNNSSIGILYRNNLSSIPIADALNRYGIQFNIKQQKLSFFTHWVVQDILAFFRFALNQRDAVSFSRICYKMKRFLSKNMVEYALNRSKEQSLLDDIAAYQGLKPFQRTAMADIKEEFYYITGCTPISAIQYIEDEFEYLDNLRNFCDERGQSFEYLKRILSILKGIGAGCSNISDFIERISQLEVLINRKTLQHARENITLSTIHSSKGLEYDTVILVDLFNEEFPGSRSIEAVKRNDDYTLLEEERRLFYVGITRAKELLYLITPLGKEAKSIFVEEISRCMNERTMNELGEGMIIHHKYFGEGVIYHIQEHGNGQVHLSVDFNGIARKLDLNLCIQNRLLDY